MHIKILSALLIVSLFSYGLADADSNVIKLSNEKCIKAQFTAKSFIRLYRIWKTETGVVYIKKNIGIIWVYSSKVAGIFNKKIFLFRKGVEPFMKEISNDDPMEFLWKNHTAAQFNIVKRGIGWEFVMKKDPEYKAFVTFDRHGIPNKIKQIDMFGNIITFSFSQKSTKCSFSIRALFNKYFNEFYGSKNRPAP